MSEKDLLDILDCRHQCLQCMNSNSVQDCSDFLQMTWELRNNFLIFFLNTEGNKDIRTEIKGNTK